MKKCCTMKEQRKETVNKKTTVCGIVAVGPNDVIGCDGIMPWYSRRDLYHFKILTTPNPCVFGKTTFMNLPVQPLPKRLNVVCSSAYKNKLCNGVLYVNSLENAIESCDMFPYVFICGGAKIYEYALQHDLIDVMYITKINDEILSENVVQHPDRYVRFPVNTDVFFGSDKWVVKKLIYPENALPKDYETVKTKFFKCCRVR